MYFHDLSSHDTEAAKFPILNSVGKSSHQPSSCGPAPTNPHTLSDSVITPKITKPILPAAAEKKWKTRLTRVSQSYLQLLFLWSLSTKGMLLPLLQVAKKMPWLVPPSSTKPLEVQAERSRVKVLRSRGAQTSAATAAVPERPMIRISSGLGLPKSADGLTSKPLFQPEGSRKCAQDIPAKAKLSAASGSCDVKVEVVTVGDSAAESDDDEGPRKIRRVVDEDEAVCKICYKKVGEAVMTDHMATHDPSKFTKKCSKVRFFLRVFYAHK